MLGMRGARARGLWGGREEGASRGWEVLARSAWCQKGAPPAGKTKTPEGGDSC